MYIIVVYTVLLLLLRLLSIKNICICYFIYFIDESLEIYTDVVYMYV